MSSILSIFNPRSNGDFFLQIKQLLGFTPRHIEYYELAFTHRSFQQKDSFGKPLNYERLEFLGDAVLSSIMAAYLFKKLPEADEGYLTQMRSKIVSRQALNKIGEDLALQQFLKADEHQHQFGKNINGNLFEALIGAVFIDRGYRYCRKFVMNKIIADYIDIPQLKGKILSYKSHLIEWCQKEKKPIRFESFEEESREEVQFFSTRLFIADEMVGKARSTSKKKAEEAAAKRAYYKLQYKM